MKLLHRIRSRIVARYKKWTFRSYVIERRVAGDQIQFLVGDLFGEAWYGPHHDPWPELEWIKANGIRPGDVVVDCGANHGFSTTLFAKWTGPQGKVYAFEPFSHNMGILKKNLRLNGITNVVCQHSAVGSQSGSVAISATQPNAAVVSNLKGTRRTEQVALVALDDILAVESIGFLKVDVEGYELEVLRGARRILASRPRLDLELHVFLYKNKAEELRQVFAMLPLNDYAVDIQLRPDGPIQSFNKRNHSIEVLSRCEVVNLLCSR